MQYPVPSSRQIFSTINLEGLIPQTRVSQENSLRGSFGLSALFYNVLLKSCFNTGDLFISEGWAGFGGENLKKIDFPGVTLRQIPPDWLKQDFSKTL